MQCYKGIRDNEFNLDIDVRKVAFFKLTVVLLGTAHWIGCMFYFLASLANFSAVDYSTTWVAQWNINTGGRWGRILLPDGTLEYHGIYMEYLIIIYRGVNALTTHDLEPFLFQREEEMILAIIAI